MYPFKSRKTYDRLYKQPPQEPIIELDTMGVIDQYFNEFCAQYARKELSLSHMTHLKQEVDAKTEGEKQKTTESDSKVNERKHNKKNTTMIHSKKVKFNENNTKTIEEINDDDNNKIENKEISEDEKIWKLLEEKIKQNLKKKDKENPLVKYFKNPLIAAVIESLIVKTIESTFKIKLNFENNEEFVPMNLVKLFDISMIALSTMSSKQEKLSYVINCMAKNIDESLDRLNQRVENQDKKMIDFQAKFIEEKKIDSIDQRDIFEWLQIKTKYQFLKKRLRTSIIEKLNHYENQEIVSISLNNNAQLSHHYNENSKNSITKINLVHIPQLSTEIILKDMNSDFTLITRRAHYNKKSKEIPKLPPKTSKETEEPFELDLDPNFSYNWDCEKEEIFKTKRKLVKNLYNEEVKCSNFLSIAFLPLVQETYLIGKKNMHRNLKLMKYAEGEWLSTEELKFLADTSSLLNKCVDRKFLQDAINIIDPKIIENLELTLSENIIMNYEKLRNTIKTARLEYIKGINTRKHEKIQLKHDELLKKEDFRLKNKENQKFRKTLENICIKMQKQGKFYSKNKEKKDIFAKLFIDKLKKGVSFKKKTPKEENVDNEKEKENPLTGPISENRKKLEIKKRRYHPSSKLFLLDKQNEEDIEFQKAEKSQQKINKKEISKFSLTLHCPLYFKNSHNFKKFYSGGPITPSRTEPFWTPYDPKKPIIANSQAEVNKIITLQKYMRKYLAKVKLQSMKEEPHHQVRESLVRLNKRNKGTRIFETFKSIKNLKKTEENGTKSPQSFIKSPKNNIISDRNIISPINPMFLSQISPIYQNLLVTKQSPSPLYQNLNIAKKNLIHHPKMSSLLTSISTKNVSTQNSVTSQDFHKKNQENSQFGGLLKHRKLLENAKIGSLTGLKTLGFSFSKGDVNYKDEYNNNALYYAAERGLSDFCDFLLRLGANPNEKCSERNTPLHMAFKSGKMAVISEMLKYGGDLNTRNKEGDSPRKLGNGRVLKEFDLKMLVGFV